MEKITFFPGFKSNLKSFLNKEKQCSNATRYYSWPTFFRNRNAIQCFQNIEFSTDAAVVLTSVLDLSIRE